MIKLIETREVVGILAIFLIVQFAGFLIAGLLLWSSSSSLVLSRITSAYSVGLSYAVDAVLLLIIVMLIINRHRKSQSERLDHGLFILFEMLVIMATSFFAFLFLFSAVLPSSLQGWYFLVSLAAAVLLVAFREGSRRFGNTATAVSSIGIGLLLGLYFSFGYALMILAAIAIYDYVAVFVTKSMIRLAKKLADEDMGFLIADSDVEAIPRSRLSSNEIEDYLKYLHESGGDSNPMVKEALSSDMVPVFSQIQLGEGDVGLPLMAAVSALYTFQSLFVGMAVICGAAVGLIATMLFLKRYKTPLPAIPPLFSFILISSGISLLLANHISAILAVDAVAGGLVIIVLSMFVTLSDRARAAQLQQ